MIRLRAADLGHPSMGRTARLLSLTVVVALQGVGCASPQSSRTSYTGGGRAGSRPIDWSTPIPSGVSEPSVGAAQRVLPFQVIEPKGLGDAEAIFVDDPQKIRSPKRTLVLVFEDPSLGRFWVSEQASEESVSTLKATVEECRNSPVCIGNPRLITLSDGSPAVLATNDESNVTAVTWLKNGVELVVMGPMDSFSAYQAIAAANAV